MVISSLYLILALLLAACCFVPLIQGGDHENELSANDSPNDVGAILSRLDQLEQKTSKIDHLEIKMEQLKKKNEELEKKFMKYSSRRIHDADADVSSKMGDQVANRESVDHGKYTPRSCHELKASDPNAQSGLYFIDPDGMANGDDAIQVHCDMDTRTTSIPHDTEDTTEVTNCEDPGCYTKEIKYSAAMRQMLVLADISKSCRQYFRFDHFSVPFEFENTQYAFWNDRNGVKQIFWAGPASSHHTCQCGLDVPNSCFDKQYNCNSDSLSPIELVDEGYITATELLPVTRLNFGRTNLPEVKASYTLGRFQCTGQAPVSSKPENCLTLFQMGHTISGFYLVKNGNTKIATTYCDFSKGSAEVEYETRIGNNDVISSAVQFYVQRNTVWSTLNTPVVFQVARLNVGDAMNIRTGVFKAPKAGTYSFTFSGTRFEGSGNHVQGFVRFRLNGKTIGSDTLGRSSSYASSIDAILKLKVGDEITVVLTAGTLYDDADHYTHFTGILLEEDLAI